MQKFEYLMLRCDYYDEVLYPRLIGGTELPNWKKNPPIHEYLNQLGEQGWELVGIPYQNIEQPSVRRFIFKRLK